MIKVDARHGTYTFNATSWVLGPDGSLTILAGTDEVASFSATRWVAVYQASAEVQEAGV